MTGTHTPRRAPLRIGMIGLGVISRFHLAALEQSPHAVLTAVCDHDPDTYAHLPPHIARYGDHRRLLRDAALDAVVVNVPNDAHTAVCHDALAAGRAVCVEKPLATTVQGARRLTEFARRQGVPLFTSFHRRYNAPVRALLGRLPHDTPITSLTVRYQETIEEHAGRDRWYLDPARCGGGCLADNGPNALDLVRLFLGDDLRVDEAVLRRDAHGVDRTADLRLTAHGTPAHVALDWSYPGERKTVEVQLADGRTDTADMLAGHTEFKGSLWHEYVGVLDDFVRTVSPTATRTRTATATATATAPGPDGLAVAELVAACYARADHDSPHPQEAPA
ncbi:Gfo/Idh/MocA family oxidoreductase [Streptomyces sp. B-S-A8]|uniref:Gfo/Idh/MocA family oxidoreductase n=1 Tax=Streptomyces solicavernae TaxID=3043614 RepID=A0ABT6RZN4_9ACTN|nr:Gfo/Idh/MocA family oxidoreductase [Streptomyces sp. B-S-A8]MDI3389899.1 Gfo/Idh/MocA family oxidoreductase [Streptomyces sp. B-S-A8]